MEKNTRIYTVFSIKGTQGSSQTYSLYQPDQKVLTNKEILEKIKKLCPEVEFTG